MEADPGSNDRRSSPPASTGPRVAAVYATPETVLDDIGRLMRLADYRAHLPADTPTYGRRGGVSGERMVELVHDEGIRVIIKETGHIVVRDFLRCVSDLVREGNVPLYVRDCLDCLRSDHGQGW